MNPTTNTHIITPNHEPHTIGIATRGQCPITYHIPTNQETPAARIKRNLDKITERLLEPAEPWDP